MDSLRTNSLKLKFKLDKVAYMGHVFSSEGLLPDPEKVSAVSDMPIPENVAAVHRLLGSDIYGKVYAKAQYHSRTSTSTDLHGQCL